MRKVLTLIALSLCVTAQGATAGNNATLILRHSRHTVYRYAYLQVGNKYLGRIYRGKSIRVPVLCNKPVSVVFYRGNRITRLSITNTPGDVRTIVLDFKKKERGTLRLLLHKKSRVFSARISISGKKKGMLYKNRLRLFRLPAGIYRVIIRSKKTAIRKKIRIHPDRITELKPLLLR